MSCEGCQKRSEALEKKLDTLITDLKPLIEFATAFMDSSAGRLQKALMRRKSGG